MKPLLRSLVRRAVCAWRASTLVLAYHHVGDATETAPWVTVSTERFAEQMAYLAQSKLVLPLDQLLAELRRERVPRGGHIVVTFDDAALDTLSTAYPILHRHGIPATLFVPTGLIGLPGAFWWNRLSRLSRTAAAKGLSFESFLVRSGFVEARPAGEDDKLWKRLRLLDRARQTEALDHAAEWLGGDGGDGGSRPMNWNELADVDATGLFTLGAHTVSHPVLSSLGEAALRAEATGCRDVLASFRSFRKVFAYPYGDAAAIGPVAEGVVRQAGFEAAFTTREAALTCRENRLALGRVCVDEMSHDDFRWLIDHYLRS